MSPALRRLLEDRAMRDAARAVVERQVAYLKDEAQQGALATRALQAGADYAGTMAEGALDLAAEHRGKLGAGAGLLVAGLAAWFFRDAIGDFVSGLLDGIADDETADEDAEPTAPPDGFPTD